MSEEFELLDAPEDSEQDAPGPEVDIEPVEPKALHALLRYPLVILLGVLLAGGTYYLMKKLGY